jgi:hypothetical protein
MDGWMDAITKMSDAEVRAASAMTEISMLAVFAGELNRPVETG